MKKEYDFTSAEQGKFCRKAEQLRIPVYLDEDVARKLAGTGGKRGRDLSRVVNKILRKEMELIEIIEK